MRTITEKMIEDKVSSLLRKKKYAITLSFNPDHSQSYFIENIELRLNGSDLRLKVIDYVVEASESFKKKLLEKIVTHYEFQRKLMEKDKKEKEYTEAYYYLYKI